MFKATPFEREIHFKLRIGPMVQASFFFEEPGRVSKFGPCKVHGLPKGESPKDSAYK